ncbi:TPA: acyltransferase [Klebsiella michiganensis]|uniref:acyltransferase family protein n=1 Tax=Klebsiella sp. TaxID=576 RepID=UPI002297CCB0|nr:acyltransferase [Klebsiella sp.]HBM2964915.1 acyltransferase [Klebsiella michiganensis]HCU0558558.1 acyltransferase [Klebsiella michiganensis]
MNRDLSIDSLRGLACLLVVFIHCLSTLYQNGILSNDFWLVKISAFLSYLRMPLFTFLSGFVYSMRPAKKENLPQFVKGKIRRILIPLVFLGTSVSALIFLFGSKGQMSINDIILSPLYPVGVYWFLDAVFVIFILAALLEIAGAFKTTKGMIIVLAIGVIISETPIRNIQFFAIGRAAYLFPFFILGIIMHRCDKLASYKNPKRKAPLSFIFSLLVGWGLFHTLNNSISPDDIKNEHWTSCAVSIAFCYLIYNLRIKSRVLSVIGGYSYSIYLLHIIFVTSPRIILSKIAPQLKYDYPVFKVLLISIFLGIAMPIFIDKVLSKYKLFSAMFLGKKNKSASKVSIA